MEYNELQESYQKSKKKMDEGAFVYDNDYHERSTSEQEKRIESFISTYKKYDPVEPILDFGAGGGSFLLAGKRLGYQRLVAVDISKEALDICKRNGLKETIYYDGSGKLSIASNSIGTLHSNQVIEHIPREESDQLLIEFYRVLKPNGKLILFFPADYSEKYNPDPTHINFYKIDDFLAQIRGLGFEVVKQYSLLFVPLLDKRVMEINLFFGQHFPVANKLIYGLKKYLYVVLKRLFKRTPGTSINLIAVKQ